MKTAFKSSVAFLLMALQVVYPVQAYAQTYFTKVPVQGLRVTSGEPLTYVNFDPSNTTREEVEAGDAILQSTPSSIDFGSFRVDQEHPNPQTVRLSNIGSQPLTLGLLTSLSSQFTVTNNCHGATLRPLATCDINISFRPTESTSTTVTSQIRIPFSSSGSDAVAQIQVQGRPLAAAPQNTTSAQLQVPGGTGGSGGSGGSTSPDGATWSVQANGRPKITFPVTIINQQTRTFTLTLASDGAAPLTYNGSSVTGHDGSFAVGSNCPASLPAGQTCNVTVSFAPETPGSKVGLLTVRTNAHNGNNLLVDLEGEAVEVYPVLTGSSNALDFGTIPQSTTAVQRDLNITNTGTAPLTISSAVLSGSTTGVSITSNTCTSSTIAVGASCLIRLTLATGTLSNVNGALTLTHDGRLSNLSPYSIPLSGAVVPQTRVLTASTSTLDFGTVDTGVAVNRTFTLTNTGNMPVSSISASVSSPYSIASNGCSGLTVQPLGSCAITVSVNTSTIGNQTPRTLTTSATSLTSPAPSVNMVAFAQTRTASVSRTSIAFGLQNTARWSDAETVVITNTGNVPIQPTILGILETGVINAWLRRSANTCDQPLEPAQSCEMAFQVQPTSSSSFSHTASIVPAPDMTGHARTVSITTTGTPQSYTASRSVLDYGVVGSTRISDLSIVFTNTSAPGVTVTGFTNSLTSPSTPTGGATATVHQNTCGSGIPAGGTCQVVIRATASPYISSADPIALTGGSFSYRFTGANTNNIIVPITLSLAGTTVTSSSASTDFGDVPTGVSSADAERRTIQVTNTGDHPVLYSDYTLGAGSLSLGEDSSIANRCVGGSTLIQPGTSCNLAFFVAEPSTATTDVTKTRVVQPRVRTLNNSVTNAGGSFTLSANMQRATIQTSTDTLNFDVVGQNTSLTRTFTYTVTHGGAATYQSPVVTGTGGYSYAGTSCGTGVNLSSIPNGTTCTVSVLLNAAQGVEGPRSGRIDLRMNIGGAAVIVGSVNLVAEVEPLVLEIVHNDLDFGTMSAQLTSAYRYAVIRNASERARFNPNGHVVHSTFELDTGTNSLVHEGQTLHNCRLSQTLAGASCFLRVRVQSHVGSNINMGLQQHNIQVTSGLPGPVVSVPAQVTRTAAELSLSHATYEFPNPTASTTNHSPDMVFTLTNNGPGRAYLPGSYTTTGNYWLIRHNGTVTQSTGANTVTGFNQCYERGSYLEAGQSCELHVRFIPTGAGGTKSGTLSFPVYEPALRTMTIALTGTGLAGVSSVSTNTFDFGQQLVSSSTERTVTITNNGTSALPLQNFTQAKENGSAAGWLTTFPWSHNCPSSLAVGASCTITVTFNPDENYNWSTQSPRESIRFQHFTNGSWSTTTLPFLAEGRGSILTVDQHSHNLGSVYIDTVTDVYSRTLTFTASGEAPVRITALTFNAKDNLQTLSGGTCAVNQVLEPGDTCTLLVRSRTDYSTRTAGSFDLTERVMTINGSYHGTGGAMVSNKNVDLRSTGVYRSPLTFTEISPRVVSNQVATNGYFIGSGFQSGIRVRVNGITQANATRETTGRIAWQFPTSLAAGSHTVSLKNMDGLDRERTYTFTVGDWPVDFSGNSAVYTLLADRPSGWSMSDAVALADGRVAITNGSSLALVDPATNLVLSSITLGVGSNARLSVQGNTVTAIGTTSGASDGVYSCGTWSCSRTYTASLDVNIAQFTLSGNTWTRTASATRRVYNYSNSVGSSNWQATAARRVTVWAAEVGVNRNNANQAAMAINFRITDGNGTVTQNSYFALSAERSGSSYSIWGNLSMSAPSDVHTLGIAHLDTYVYIRHGNTIRTFSRSGDSLTALNNYTYSAALDSDSSRGLTYSTSGGELLLGCYAGTVLCRVTASAGALGTMQMLAGQSGSLGYADGTHANSLLRTRVVRESPEGAIIIHTDTSPSPVRVIKR